VCRPAALSAWTAELESVFPHLSRPQVKVLAEYSHGMILAGKCGLSSVAAALGGWLGESSSTVRERLRDFYCDGVDKSGKHRRSLEIQSCFAPLLKWVLSDWQSDQLAIALDATTLGQRFVVLAISIVYRSGAIPVAWVVLPAVGKGQWRPCWIELLRCFKQTVPPHLRVIALADRGLYAKWLFKEIVDLGWHPFLRINAGGNEFTPEGTKEAIPLNAIDGGGKDYVCRGTLFKSKKARLGCTLAVRHDPAYTDGWYVVSDLPPEQMNIACYGLRCWIEPSFKHHKSGGWNWQKTRMTRAARAGRAWLVMAVADVLLMRQAAIETPIHALTTHKPAQPQKHSTQAAASPPEPSSQPPAQKHHRRRKRTLSVFCLSLITVQMTLLSNKPLPHGQFNPEPWPSNAFPIQLYAAAVQPP
jgi:hypothetical protein